MSHWIGVGVQAPSMPEVMVSSPIPLAWPEIQPMPCWAMSAPSGETPTLDASPAPWALPKVWPPTVRATVSSSFMPIRAKVSRMSRADCRASGTPPGPSGFT